QTFCHRLDRAPDVPLRLRGGPKERDTGQCLCRQHRAGPRAKILGSEILAADLAEIDIDVRRVDDLSLAVSADVLKQLVARKIAAHLHDPREPRIAQVDRVLDPALAAKLEAHA